jgi:hypothetical protein
MLKFIDNFKRVTRKTPRVPPMFEIKPISVVWGNCETFVYLKEG